MRPVAVVKKVEGALVPGSPFLLHPSWQCIMKSELKVVYSGPSG